jgi:hypothetical protein
MKSSGVNCSDENLKLSVCTKTCGTNPEDFESKDYTRTCKCDITGCIWNSNEVLSYAKLTINYLKRRPKIQYFENWSKNKLNYQKNMVFILHFIQYDSYFMIDT